MSASASTTAPAPRDFSDWFSPMLVKELRQGLRGRVFVITFLAQQGFLIYVMLKEMIAESENNLLWMLVSLVLLVVMPLRGIMSLALEIRYRNLELIQLTGLSGKAIVFGAWSALFAQTLLFITAVLPYVLLRYYVAGVEVIGQLYHLFQLLGVSAILTAAAVAISAFLRTTQRLVGTFIASPFFLPVGGSILFAIIQFPAYSMGLDPDTADPVMLLWLVLFTVLSVVLSLLIGADALVPPEWDEYHMCTAAGVGNQS